MGCREVCANSPAGYREGTGKVQGRYREGTGKVQGGVRELACRGGARARARRTRSAAAAAAAIARACFSSGPAEPWLASAPGFGPAASRAARTAALPDPHPESETALRPPSSAVRGLPSSLRPLPPNGGRLGAEKEFPALPELAAEAGGREWEKLAEPRATCTSTSDTACGRDSTVSMIDLSSPCPVSTCTAPAVISPPRSPR